ncbi:hypothetical protein SAMN05444004_11473 [Jannaschia faecimaris]|uniref:Uncharacterized protein n=1 Tax=Jannaschia faecimaris TaxID=1244108 RepID=A0A1H3SZZ7_9RHOB|nr:hypothetical protein [Jannaschia faecimaris]SDZ43350.1 hypothetical protein SAMN05444004_11473 [Jannaschia faecimaris]
MSKFNWRNGPAAGLVLGVFIFCMSGWLLWTLSANQTEHRVRSEEAAKRYTEYAEDRVDEMCFRLDGQALRRCIQEEIETSHDHNRSDQDLDAQQTMAFFTQIMGATALLGVVLGVGSVALIYMTLSETREMTAQARGMGRDQSRAYVHADRAHFFWGGESQKHPRVEIWVRNTGLTPANWYEIRIKDLVYPHEGFDETTPLIDQVKLPEKFEGPWNAIPADSKGNKATFHFDRDETKRIKLAAMDGLGLSAPTYGLSIVGEIRYQTFFGEVFVSQFVFGRSMLPAYRLERSETRDVDGVKVTDNIEKPIHLSRYAAKIDTYKKVQREG